LKCSILSAAELEAADAATWYDDQREGLGDEFLAAFKQALHQIESRPDSLARVEGYRGPHDVRRCILRRFPYAVIYLCRRDESLILAVSHLRRRPLYWLDRLT